MYQHFTTSQRRVSGFAKLLFAYFLPSIFLTSLAQASTSPVSGFSGIAAGGYHSCAIRNSDLSVWCWGQNQYGQLGDGTTVSKKTPVQVSDLDNVKALSASLSHTCAIKNDLSLWCWGYNGFGQLGDGTKTSRPTPVAINGQFSSNINAIATGFYHTCAIKNDSSIWCWGHNTQGQLGDGTTADRLIPVPINTENLNAAISIVSGSSHSCAISASDSSMWCWGYNLYGQLGDGTTTTRLTPTVVNLTSVGALTAGNYHSCALKIDFSAWCWGNNDNGQLGDGTTTQRTIPVNVNNNNLGNINNLHAGGYHTCALKNSDSTLWCWGDNDYSELGDGTKISRSTPVQVNNSTLNNANALSLGEYHTCASRADSTLWCWGNNSNSQLGDNTSSERNMPVSVVTNNPTITLNFSETDLTIDEDTSTQALSLTIGDSETAAANLTLSGTSSDLDLLPQDNIVFALVSGDAAARTVTVTLTPVANQNGSTTITLIVNDGNGGSVTTDFTLFVTAINDTPTISAIEAQSTAMNTATSPIAFSIGDVETASDNLIVSGASSNTLLIPEANIIFGGSGSDRNVTITPATGKTGTALITITVTDGGTLSAATTFEITVIEPSTLSITQSAFDTRISEGQRFDHTVTISREAGAPPGDATITMTLSPGLSDVQWALCIPTINGGLECGQYSSQVGTDNEGNTVITQTLNINPGETIGFDLNIFLDLGASELPLGISVRAVENNGILSSDSNGSISIPASLFAAGFE